jgi:hypothetical protein
LTSLMSLALREVSLLITSDISLIVSDSVSQTSINLTRIWGSVGRFLEVSILWNSLPEGVLILSFKVYTSGYFVSSFNRLRPKWASLEAISKHQIAFEGKAGADDKAQHPRGVCEHFEKALNTANNTLWHACHRGVIQQKSRTL